VRGSAVTSELTSLRRLSTLWLVAAALVLTAFITVISFTGSSENTVRNGPAPGGVSIAQLELPGGIVAGVAQASDFLGLIVLGLFAFSFASDFSQGTIRNLLVRQPKRLRLAFGKWAALCLVAIALALLVTVCTALVAIVVAPGQGVDTSAWTVSSLSECVLTCAVGLVGYGTLGGALGLLLRSPVAAVGLGALYLLPLETVVSGTWSEGEKWLPGQLLGVVIEGGSSAVDLGPALLRASLVLVVLTVVAVSVFRARDIVE
jgi:ABC-type transport system involved in multi-copper enzyme maturation permease subunit